MQEKTDEEILDFVGQTFGELFSKRLKKIGQGGDNNKKGGDFEAFYATSKICILGASHGPGALDYVISCQETAFVDDLCVRQTSVSVKTNYQAKNSSGSAADWDADMQERFHMQQQIDVSMHQAGCAFQILLVSDAQKAAANDAKIPELMKPYSSSEYFPFRQASNTLIQDHPPLRMALRTLCNSDNLATLDTAFKVVLGQWGADNAAGRNVGEVLLCAKRTMKPNLLPGVTDPADIRPIPDWLRLLLEAFHLPPATVECGAIRVAKNGFVATVDFEVPEPTEKILAGLSSRGDVFDFLMSLEAAQLVNQKPIGDSDE